MIKHEKNELFIELTELSKIIKARDSRSVVKWCNDYNLPIIPIGKNRVTYRFLAETALEKRLLKVLKKQYPSNWKELYNYYKDNDHYSYLMAIQKEAPNTVKIDTNVKPRSRFAKEFAKD